MNIPAVAFGILFLGIATDSLRTGRTMGSPGIGGMVYRKENPGTFWFHIVVKAIIGIALCIVAVLE